MAKFLQVALNVPLNQTFTYLNIEPVEKTRTGCRVEIKFGARRTKGCVISESDALPDECPVEEDKIRPITKVIDESPLINSELLGLAQWVSRYYLCPIGEAVSAMLPSAKRESETGGLSFQDEIPEEKPRELSGEQQVAVDGILADFDNKANDAKSKPGDNDVASKQLKPASFSNKNSYATGGRYHYLYGPTGSGKTEVFLQCAQKMLDNGKGVIYLVPEIGLTRQVVEAVSRRFGNTVAVLHSGLTPSQRLCEYHRIISREARVVVGARSAVFAPVPDLGMIIIDEEHDSSYKSGSSPRYHARQVAMHRCQQAGIPLVMGSATPSVEAWYLMDRGIILRHTLSRRLAGGAMPHIKAIDLSNEPQGTGCISRELEKEINSTLKEKRQTILFLNRRGFTHFYRCRTCGFELKCKNCSVSMTFHKAENRLRCHYCGWNIAPPQQCPQCGSLDAGYSGFGTEFIEAEVKAKFPDARIVRIDTDSTRGKGELEEKLDAFKKNEYDIMLGTQMVAKGLNFPSLKLVGVVLADTGLHMPDFRAAERTFSLITQVAGRTGRFFADGKVLVQTYSPERTPVLLAVNSETEKFYEEEIKSRRALNFPPFSRLVRLVFRAPTARQAEQAASGAAEILRSVLTELYRKPQENGFFQEQKEIIGETEILGPAECPLSKIALNWRFQIILRGKSIKVLQAACASFLYNYSRPADVYIETDVDPVSML